MTPAPVATSTAAAAATTAAGGTPRPTANQCPNPEGRNSNTCRGPIPAGTYTTITSTPQLTYTVPAGWGNLEDLPGNFLLLPPGSTLAGVNPGTSDYLGVYTSVVAPAHCTGGPSTTVPPTFDGLIGFLTSNPALDITNRHDVAIGGFDGVAMDIAMKGTTGDGCTDGAFADLYVGAEPSSLVHAVDGDNPVRLYLLRTGSRTLAIEMADAPNGGSDIEDWWATASDVAATFVFRKA